MKRVLICSAGFLLGTTGIRAETGTADSLLAQAVLSEIRQFRQDLQATAAIIQRVQILVHRIQSQETMLDRATQRLETARNICNDAETRQKDFAAQLERLETAKRNAQNPSERQSAENRLAEFKEYAETAANETRGCQGNQVEAEIQFRTEQARMSELQDQLDKLDRILASDGRK